MVYEINARISCVLEIYLKKNKTLSSTELIIYQNEIVVGGSYHIILRFIAIVLL